MAALPAALAVLLLLSFSTAEEDRLLDNAERVGAELLAGLRSLEERFPGRVDNSRGRGMFAAFDLPDGETRGRVLEAMLEAGVLGLPSGARSLRFRPPLTLTSEEATEGLARLESALASVPA